VFASAIKGAVEISGGVTVSIRALSWKSLKKAADAQQAEAIATAKGAGADVLQAFSAMKADPDRVDAMRTKIAKDARYTSHDLETVLRSGIEAFSDHTDKEKGLTELTEADATKTFRAIIDLSLPTPEEAEAEQGKGSVDSIST